MNSFEKTFSVKTNAKSTNTKVRGNIRITALTSRLVRVEIQNDKKFCDMPTQAVINRNFDSPEFSVTDNFKNIIVKTDDAAFIFDYECKELLEVIFADGKHVTAVKSGNLKGTRRTLDMTFGEVKLGDGVVSRNGVAEIDDSETLIIMEDGTIQPRKDVLCREENGTDKYYFAYGHDYEEAVADLYRLTGATPLIPRFALGNWWSRYKAYTQTEYLSLMQRFIDEEIPITVATIDMDWHWVDVVKKFGKEASFGIKTKNVYDYFQGSYMNPGWTGYSWNTELFPDYKGFLKTLKDENLKITVNLHPAGGVKCYEDMYKDFAEYMGINPESKERIEFDITDKKFVEGYFEYCHHCYENDGVDFWWIDWQQGKKTKVEGLDPLWALNHYHSLDIARDGKRPLILSRFAGVGSHRYPLGFSGDTTVNWDVLAFQPYFTSTASNVGYSWWSHDIGGHHLGERDDELYMRWLQFGVFSPIMRLHSTSNEFLGKEPWKYCHEAQQSAVISLRFRHRLIPYIYTMNHRTHKDGTPLMEPMYYHCPEDDDAYNVPNEYFFGSELIVAPITEKLNSKLRMAGVDVYLPNGRYTDIFNGNIYEGGRKFRMFRDTASIPVLAKEGAVIPLSVNDKINDWKNPDEMEILIFRGNGSFDMYEDDGETMNYEKGACALTLFEVNEDGNDVKFVINKTTGDTSVVPENRKYILSFRDIADSEKITVSVNGKRFSYASKKNNGSLSVTLTDITPDDKVTVSLKNITAKRNASRRELLITLFSKVQGSNTSKMMTYTKLIEDNSKLSSIRDKDVRCAAGEISAMEAYCE